MASLEEIRARAARLKAMAAAVESVGAPQETPPATQDPSEPTAPGQSPVQATEKSPARQALHETLRRVAPHAVNDPETALHQGFQQIKDTGSLGLELARSIERMKDTIDSRVVKIFTIMDEAAGRALNGEAYVYDSATRQPVPIDGNTFNDQLKATMNTAANFAKIVEVLPQEIATLVTELNDAERSFEAVLLRQAAPTPSTPPSIDPWNPARAAREQTDESIQRSLPQLPVQPAFAHGARETERVFGVASNMLEAIQALKNRVDAQTIHILNTINEAASRALDGEAYTDADGVIAAVKDDPSLVNRLETTVRVAGDLVEIMRRLPDEIQTLISEIRDAEKRFFGVLNDKS